MTSYRNTSFEVWIATEKELIEPVNLISNCISYFLFKEIRKQRYTTCLHQSLNMKIDNITSFKFNMALSLSLSLVTHLRVPFGTVKSVF